MVVLERDLQIVEAIAANLKEYLLSKTLYWTLSESGPIAQPFPSGTLGGLLLRLYRLEALTTQLSADQEQRLRAARTETDHKLNE